MGGRLKDVSLNCFRTYWYAWFVVCYMMRWLSCLWSLLHDLMTIFFVISVTWSNDYLVCDFCCMMQCLSCLCCLLQLFYCWNHDYCLWIVIACSLCSLIWYNVLCSNKPFQDAPQVQAWGQSWKEGASFEKGPSRIWGQNSWDKEAY